MLDILQIQAVDPGRIDMLQWTVFAILGIVIVIVIDRFHPFIQKTVAFIQPSESEQAAQYYRIRKMYRKTILGWVVIDKDRKVVLWSPRMVKKFGWTEKEALGKTLDDLIVPDETKDAHWKKFQHFVDTGQSDIIGNKYGYNIEAITKDKKRIPIRLILSDISENGIIEIGGYVFDRTQEVEREKEYEKIIKFLECAEVISGTGYWYWDLIKKDVWVSKNFRILFNIDEDVPVTSNILMDYIFPEDREKTATAINAALDDGKDYEVIYRRRIQNGELAEIICKGVRITDKEGKTKMLHGIIQRINDD